MSAVAPSTAMGRLEEALTEVLVEGGVEEGVQSAVRVRHQSEEMERVDAPARRRRFLRVDRQRHLATKTQAIDDRIHVARLNDCRDGRFKRLFEKRQRPSSETDNRRCFYNGAT